MWLLTAGDELGLYSRRIRVNGRLMPDDGTASLTVSPRSVFFSYTVVIPRSLLTERCGSQAPTQAELAGKQLPAADSAVLLEGLSAAFVVDARAGPCGSSGGTTAILSP